MQLGICDYLSKLHNINGYIKNLISGGYIMKNTNHFILCFLAITSLCSISKIYGMELEEQQDQAAAAQPAQKCFKTLDSFISQGVFDVSRHGRNGITPLMLAIQINDKSMFDFLIEHRADASALDQDGQNIIHYAAIANNAAVIQLARQLKATPSLASRKLRQTPLMLAAKNGCMTALLELCRLEEVTKSMDMQDIRGNTAFLIALDQGHPECANALLNAQASSRVCNYDGLNALLIAFIFITKSPDKEQEYVQFLKDFIPKITIPFFINIANPANGWTPLHYAANIKSNELIILLINNGANPSMKNKLGFIPLVIAVQPVEGRAAIAQDVLAQLQPAAEPQVTIVRRAWNAAKKVAHIPAQIIRLIPSKNESEPQQKRQRGGEIAQAAEVPVNPAAQQQRDGSVDPENKMLQGLFDAQAQNQSERAEHASAPEAPAEH